jgi:hypothetical protein
VVTATLGSQGDALVVTHRPDIDPLEDAAPGTVTDDLLRALWKEVAKLHASGMSHGRLNGRNIAVVDGKPVLIDFSVATLGAADGHRHRRGRVAGRDDGVGRTGPRARLGAPRRRRRRGQGAIPFWSVRAHPTCATWPTTTRSS